ncbi:phosphotransferase [Mobiluncus mulieris]|uniref:Phosphotransferase n=1 Tax=Mobiluncus mulieris TaxID=2052 RepID=A0A7Y0U659_9ACTO|nr:phosphotransferase [Mobiluncus mulieris]MCU9969126.1 phosphotransferase [Mobiluncus mulieris]MCV0009551.1 phosphotransferase [Mobiluncus mulieris]NMW64869.1 phosphotransferase [Mobiluncus mulieris]NMW75387.1 phosphotransferase [Mobiluncus mulieris]NMX03852.1 phosphotransferase [Mobiluncus mulieris]
MSENLFLTLAALATVACPDLEVEGLCPPTGDDEDFAWTGVLDHESSRWMVLASLSDTGKESLEKQEKILAMLANYHDAHRITFEVPRPVGRTNGHISRGDAGGIVPPEKISLQAIVYRMLPGNPLEFGDIGANSDMARSLGRAIAMLHEVPASIVPHSGLPSFTVAEIRDKLREKLSTAVSTGLVPPTLQARWEQALAEDAWWRFHPTFVHGSLEAQKVLVADSRVLGISDFAEVCVDDPAKDLAWLLTELSEQTVDSIFDAYHLGRAEGADSFLRQRSELYNELALVDWLNWGVAQENPAIIADAQELMEEQLERLDGDLSLTGKPLFDADTDTIELDGSKDAPTTNSSETETP